MPFLRILYLFFILPVGFAIAQQNKIISIGATEQLTSGTLNESRDIQVYQPEGQKTPLPVILVFDGESLFVSVVSAVKFMNYSQELPQIPEAIVIGIPNTDRNRDMPIPQSYGGKGEENFAHFVSDELIPWLEKKYNINGHIVLIGHSQGGLFVSYLMAQSPGTFNSAIALDGPMDLDNKTAGIKQKIAQQANAPGSAIRYASMETSYGWGKDWESMMAKATGALKMEYHEETHESMPYKAIYDGLKFIYRGFAPPKRDMQLIGLLHHYDDISKQFGHDYDVPQQVLLASANRKIMDSRKADAMELLQFAEEKYGSSQRIISLRDKASRLPDKVDPLVDFYMKHPKPTAQEIKPYIGRWVGELIVPQGQPLPVDFEIKVENGAGKMISVLPWPPYKKEESEILFVDKAGQLVFGRKNRGAGLIISTSHITGDGHLVGKEELVGFTIPEDVPDDVKAMMKFTLENPVKFDLKSKN